VLEREHLGVVRVRLTGNLVRVGASLNDRTLFAAATPVDLTRLGQQYVVSVRVTQV